MRDTGDLAREILEAIIRGEMPPKMDLQEALDDLVDIKKECDADREEWEDERECLQEEVNEREMERDEYIEKYTDLDNELDDLREKVERYDLILSDWVAAFEKWDTAGADIERREWGYNDLVQVLKETKDRD